jgi:hypothetical protein
MTVSIRLDADLLRGLDDFIQDRDHPPEGRMDREAAVNVIIRDWLQGQGFIPLPSDPDGIVPALEAANVPD